MDMKRFAGVFLVLSLAARADAQVAVHAGGDLQAALDAVTPGQTVTLDAGATFTGNFTLKAKTGTAVITIRTSTPDANLPGPTTRIQPEQEPLLARLSSPNAIPALRTNPGASNYRLIGLLFTAGSSGAIVAFGDGTNADPALTPANLTIDHSIIRTDPSTSKNGLEMNAANVTVRNSRITGVKLAGVESHAMIVWNGPGPFVIENNYLEAGSCGFFVGGAAPSIPNLIPSDVTFRWNTVTRPLAMHRETGWAVKNLFELKNVQRVVATGNLFELNWPDGQGGFAIVLTVRANSLAAPWTTIRDVLFADNVIRHVAMPFNILGLDNQVIGGVVAPSQPMDGVTIRNNLIHGVDRQVWTSPAGVMGSGIIFQIDGAPRNLRIEHNTAVGPVTGNIMALSGPPMPGLVVRDNIFQKQVKPDFLFDTFGIFGNAVGEGNVAFTTYAPDLVFTGNVLAGATPATYSSRPGNLFPTVAALHADFMNEAVGNFRLVPGSALAGKGIDQDAIDAAMGPLAPGAPVTAPSSPTGHVLLGVN